MNSTQNIIVQLQCITTVTNEREIEASKCYEDYCLLGYFPCSLVDIYRNFIELTASSLKAETFTSLHCIASQKAKRHSHRRVNLIFQRTSLFSPFFLYVSFKETG
jgi:hypothetical protein